MASKSAGDVMRLLYTVDRVAELAKPSPCSPGRPERMGPRLREEREVLLGRTDVEVTWYRDGSIGLGDDDDYISLTKEQAARLVELLSSGERRRGVRDGE